MNEFLATTGTGRIEQARIKLQAMPVNDTHALTADARSNLRDLSVHHQHRAVAYGGSRYRMHCHIPHQNRIARGRSENRQRRKTATTRTSFRQSYQFFSHDGLFKGRAGMNSLGTAPGLASRCRCPFKRIGLRAVFRPVASFLRLLCGLPRRCLCRRIAGNAPIALRVDESRLYH